MTAPPILKTLAGIGVLVTGLVVTYYALVFEGPLPDHPALRGRNDLVLHAAAFFALSLLVLLLDSRWRNIAGLIGFAGLIEIVQIFQPHRSAGWGDFMGSVGGIGLAALLVWGMRAVASLIASKEVECDE